MKRVVSPALQGVSRVGEFLVASPIRTFFIFTGVAALLEVAVHLITYGGVLDPAVPIALVGVGTASCWLMHDNRMKGKDIDDVND
ncbi:MAG: hypothetical protein E6R04_06585 [Spirochaetes bacterium]|nr:MAG: hypothetical protein E6R04_06585 [Spirochaetota bacterium]